MIHFSCMASSSDLSRMQPDIGECLNANDTPVTAFQILFCLAVGVWACESFKARYSVVETCTVLFFSVIGTD